MTEKENNCDLKLLLIQTKKGDWENDWEKIWWKNKKKKQKEISEWIKKERIFVELRVNIC